jgi:cytochrome c oxidase subunit IV
MSKTRSWLVAVSTLLLAGCVTHTVSEGSETFYYDRVLLTLVLLIGGALLPIGFFVKKAYDRLGWGMMIVGPLLALVVALIMWFEHVKVTDQRIIVRSGVFGNTAAQDIPLERVKVIRITEERSGSGRNSRMIDVLYFSGDGGDIAVLPLNNDVKSTAARAILDRANARGVAIVGR